MQAAHHHVLFVGVESPPSEYLRRCENIRAAWHYLPKEAGKGHLKFQLAIYRQIVANDPDLLFLHGLAAMPAVALLKIFSSDKKPFVLVRETQANNLKTRIDWISLFLAHRFVQRIVHLTDEAANGAAQRLRGFTRTANVTVVPNGLDTDFYTPTKSDSGGKGVVHIGMQSRLQPNKDHTTLISGFMQICQRHPAMHFHLHIAGDGSTCSAIKQMVHQSGLSGVTTMHGMLDQSRLRNFLNGLDIYVHCTHGETMSTAIMQALSCGLPVIASHVPGVANMVLPEAGLLYRPGDPIDLADKLDELLGNPDTLQAWRQRARSYAVKNYSIAATVCAYQALVPDDSATVIPSKVVHVIPYDGVGGVESAARSMGVMKQGNINFEVDFIFKNVEGRRKSWATLNPFPIFSAARRASRSDTDLVIVSLWRSAIVGLLAKLLHPQLKLVTFLHNSTNVHFLDLCFNRLSVLFSTEVWADSKVTLSGRVPDIRSDNCRVISFVTRRFEALQERAADLSFIFWGRITQQKGLDRAIRLFAEVHKRYPKARYWVVGPDGGALLATQALCASLGLKNAVSFLGAATHDEIIGYARQATFYLQTSHFEGMAMAVVEAMQLGLVPVVTPVGEIANYCKAGVNAVVIRSDQKAVEDIINLLNTVEQYQSTRANAIATWLHQPLYRDSVLAACEAVLSGHCAS